ncbi:MAG: hypothetical protein K8T89_18645 [Planctomycetes bacterium]|nr:hypothetical protein [Planctomycetota bacterium]
MVRKRLYVYIKDDEAPIWFRFLIGLILCSIGAGALALFDLHASYWLIPVIICIAIGGLVILFAGYSSLGPRGVAACTVHEGGIHLNIEPPVYFAWSDVGSTIFEGEGNNARLKIIDREGNQTAIKLHRCAVKIDTLKNAIDVCSRHPDSETLFLTCPACHFSVDTLKEYTVGNFLLLFVVGALKKQRVIACPSCMRSHALQMLAGNLLSANLLWPIIVLPWGTWLLARSFFGKGHSNDVMLSLN